METRLDYLSYQSTYRELNDLLQTTSHESYPLVDAPGEITGPLTLCYRYSSSDHMTLWLMLSFQWNLQYNGDTWAFCPGYKRGVSTLESPLLEVEVLIKSLSALS